MCVYKYNLHALTQDRGGGGRAVWCVRETGKKEIDGKPDALCVCVWVNAQEKMAIAFDMNSQ